MEKRSFYYFFSCSIALFCSVSCEISLKCSAKQQSVKKQFETDSKDILNRVKSIYECGRTNLKSDGLRFYYGRCIVNLEVPFSYEDFVLEMKVEDFASNGTFTKKIESFGKLVCDLLNENVDLSTETIECSVTDKSFGNFYIGNRFDFGVFLVVGLAILGILTFWMVKRNYRPIENLVPANYGLNIYPNLPKKSLNYNHLNPYTFQYPQNNLPVVNQSSFMSVQPPPYTPFKTF